MPGIRLPVSFPDYYSSDFAEHPQLRRGSFAPLSALVLSWGPLLRSLLSLHSLPPTRQPWKARLLESIGYTFAVRITYLRTRRIPTRFGATMITKYLIASCDWPQALDITALGCG